MADTATAVNDAGTVDAAPATFAEAFAADASPASTSPEQTTTPAEAEQPPAAQDSPQQSDERSPFIPRERFDEVNTKLKELREWREQRAWAEQVDANTFQQMTEWYQRAHTDPLTFTTGLIAELQAHPEYGPQLRSLAAKTLAQGRGQAPPDLSGLVIDLGNGQTIPLSVLREQIAQDVRKEYEPLAKTVEQINTERAEAQAQSFATTELSKARKELPNFTEHESEIKVKLAAMKLPPDAGPELVSLALHAAYAQVVPSKLRQTTTQHAESQLLDNLKKKAHASTVNPGSVASATPKRYDSFADLPADAWK